MMKITVTVAKLEVILFLDKTTPENGNLKIWKIMIHYYFKLLQLMIIYIGMIMV